VWTAADFQGIKREAGLDFSDDSSLDEELNEAASFEEHFVGKRRRLERRKSVRFADEEDSELECVYPIPVKEETWPYGSLSGDSVPKAFPEFDHLYGQTMKASKDMLDSKNFVGSENDEPTANDLACFDNLKECVGMAFLMMDGSIARGVCATSQGLWGKLFMRYETLLDKGLLDPESTKGMRPADYLETDSYKQVHRSEVASVCRILCVDADLPPEKDDDSTLASLTGSDPTYNGKSMKTFFYSWYCCLSSRTAYPYLSEESRAVRVFWPEDRRWYLGGLEGVEGGCHRVVYDCDGSVEVVNLLQLREQGCLQFIG